VPLHFSPIFSSECNENNDKLIVNDKSERRRKEEAGSYLKTET
jgi:hypothetical protein